MLLINTSLLAIFYGFEVSSKPVAIQFLVPSVEWSWRLALILGFLLATLPVASHLLARAAVAEAGMADQIRDAPLVGDDPC